MPRPPRVFFDGAIYHVFNKLARGQRDLADPAVAERFVGVLREVVKRDEITVYAWCMMSNHYHLAVRTASVPIDRPMKTVQQKTAMLINRLGEVSGPVWQGRYRAKLVEDQDYLEQLLAYIHLNPVSAGLVKNPIDYGFSGHAEIVGATPHRVVDVDATLALFSRRRSTARRQYIRLLDLVGEEDWSPETVGRLPWWRTGRPKVPNVEEKDEIPLPSYDVQDLPSRPVLTVDQFLRRAAKVLDIGVADLGGPGRERRLVEARAMIAAIGNERYGLRLAHMAVALNKTRATMSNAIKRARSRRTVDADYRRSLDRLDATIALSAGE